jgi:hypothetical protein
MDVIKRYRDIGFGSINYLPWSAATQIEENKQLLTLIPQYKTDFTVEAVKAVSFAKHGFKDLRKIGELTPEIEKKIEDAAFEAAQTYPEINIWYLGSELEYLVHDGDYKKFAKLQLAAAKGVRRFDSGKKFYLGGSCNMEPRSGTMHVDKYLKTVRELDSSFKFDGVTIHPYRTMPEHPDLDDDAAYFFSVLDKHGYKDAPVLWEEGIYYTYYNIPAWGLDPHQGCTTDHYRAGCPSYHMGWGERIAAAYFARSWLVALKYQDRVKQFNGWCSWMSMDAYLTPFALQKIPNTLGHLLGNAVFKQDIRFAPEMRCYVFEDEKKRPVAALWSHMPNVDRGFGESPKAAFNFKGQSPEFIDLMENPRSAGMDKDGNCEIQVTPFPLFIRGGAGDWDKLCASVRNARSLNSDKASLQISAKPLSASGLEITFVNQVTRDFNGKILLSAGGKPVERDLSLKGRESVKITVPMSVPIPADKIADIRLPVEILETGVKPFKTDLSFTAFAVKKLSGQTPDWKNIPAIKITNRSIHKSTSSGTDNTLVTEAAGYPGDFEAEYQMAWSKDDLWLRVNVTDDVFYHDANKKDTGGRYYNDSLQIYIDSLCNARQKETKGFDGDDYNYDFYPNMVKGSTSEPDGAVTAFRRYCPEQQMIGGLFAVQPNTVEPDIKGSFKKTDKGYVYDLKIPGRLIAPVELRDGSVCGFCVYLNDHDGKCVKGALSTTSEPGTGGYQNPHLYPVMLLTE